jgi:poly(A) polymerase
VKPGLHRLLDDAGAKRVLDALGDGSDVARFVGGAVRDALLDRPLHDIDIATSRLPEETLALLDTAGIKSVPTGLKHGTITAVVNGRGIEVTTLRLDVATDGRHAEVAFTDDWRADASRRDFTMNALSLDRSGDVHDYFGGQDDLTARRVRFVGDADTRVREDYLRILRFFRFFAWYGEGMPDEAALSACTAGREGLQRLSAERIRVEMLKLLAAPRPLPAIQAMADVGVLAELLGQAATPSGLAMLLPIELEADPLLRLVALSPGDKAHMLSIAECLRVSNAERRRLTDLALPLDDLNAPPEIALHRLGADLYRQRALLSAAIEGSRYEERMVAADAWTPQQFPIAGRDLLALGIPKGPDVGELLSVLETWWITGGFRAQKADILAEAKVRIGRPAAANGAKT